MLTATFIHVSRPWDGSIAALNILCFEFDPLGYRFDSGSLGVVHLDFPAPVGTVTLRTGQALARMDVGAVVVIAGYPTGK